MVRIFSIPLHLLVEADYLEVYSYVRSPHRNLFVYDTVVQVRHVQRLAANIIHFVSTIRLPVCPTLQTTSGITGGTLIANHRIYGCTMIVPDRQALEDDDLHYLCRLDHHPEDNALRAVAVWCLPQKNSWREVF